tara:strand:- start:1415 stop:1648 length:234 start_codon:yes stop_codon:yes gene_type:complete
MSNKKYTTQTRKADFKDDNLPPNYDKVPPSHPRGKFAPAPPQSIPVSPKKQKKDFGPSVINPYDYLKKKKKKRYYDV